VPSSAYSVPLSLVKQLDPLLKKAPEVGDLVLGGVQEPEQLLGMFHAFDIKYGNNPKNYLVIALADGIFRRETAMLLKMSEVRGRIHRLIFCVPDSTAVFGGLRVLKDELDLNPDAISGLCSSSPLAIREIRGFGDLPVLSQDLRYHRLIHRAGSVAATDDAAPEPTTADGAENAPCQGAIETDGAAFWYADLQSACRPQGRRKGAGTVPERWVRRRIQQNKQFLTNTSPRTA
jgi:hypothetical protein